MQDPARSPSHRKLKSRGPAQKFTAAGREHWGVLVWGPMRSRHGPSARSAYVEGSVRTRSDSDFAFGFSSVQVSLS
jgi:hypothetical protein